jgi:hypothetical protein
MSVCQQNLVLEDLKLVKTGYNPEIMFNQFVLIYFDKV